MTGRRIAPALAVALAACSPPGGTLTPVAGPGVALVSTHGLPGDTARLSAGGVIADVTGAWSRSGVSLEVRYRAGATGARMQIAPTLTREGRMIAAAGAWDRTTAEPGNVMGRPLLAGSLAMRPAGRRTVAIEFEVASPPAPALASGNEVTVTVPMPGGARPVRFTLGPR